MFTLLILITALTRCMRQPNQNKRDGSKHLPLFAICPVSPGLTLLSSYFEFSCENVKYQLDKPHLHRANAAKRAIQTFKAHFKAGLASLDPAFPVISDAHNGARFFSMDLKDMFLHTPMAR